MPWVIQLQVSHRVNSYENVGTLHEFPDGWEGLPAWRECTSTENKEGVSNTVNAVVITPDLTTQRTLQQCRFERGLAVDTCEISRKEAQS
jgi:hypothetical protein